MSGKQVFIYGMLKYKYLKKLRLRSLFNINNLIQSFTIITHTGLETV